MLATLKARTFELARKPYAEWALFGFSFAESSIFPLPPDPLLGIMAAAEPKKWLRYAVVCTVASVLGGVLGYGIGMFLMDSIGEWILNVFGYAGERREALEAQYAQYGLWVIFIKGLTPIPYKLVTIVSGAAAFDIWMFLGASIVTRGVRFFAEVGLLKLFGPAIRTFVEKYLTLVTTAFLIVVVGGFIVVARFL